MTGAATEVVIDKQRMTEAMDRAAPGPPPVVGMPIGTRPIRATRIRVGKVFNRLRRRNQSTSRKRLPLDRLDEAQSEDKSEISGITDIEYGDEMSWDGGKPMGKQGEKNKTNPMAFEPSQRLPHSLVPSFPSTTLNSVDPSLSQSLETWFDSLSCLAKSKEMNSFLHSSNKLAASAASKSLETARTVGEIAVHTALLPVTLPLHVTASATGLVFNTGSNALHYFCDNLVPIVINHSIKIPLRAATIESDPSNRSESRTKTATSESEKAKSIRKQVAIEEYSHHHDDFLDRLRLDSHLIAGMDKNGGNTTSSDEASLAVYSIETDSLTLMLDESMKNSSNCSKFLLRVDDLNVNLKENPASDSQERLFCVDLDKEFSDDELTSDALTQLAQRCVDISFSNEFVFNMLPEETQQQYCAVDTIRVHWKPLGQTKNDYNRLIKLPRNEYYDELCTRVCTTWTGKWVGKKYHGCEHPFFMAQGVVNGSPIEILDLLWDSKRVKEYNKHCVSREDVFSVGEDEEPANMTKIIHSETKIPFTSMSVHLSAVMCAKLLGSQPEDGSVIFSRSLGRGPAGNHSSKAEGRCKTGKNEVILGINIIRPVAGRPGLTDLISISQVDASILPPFLKARVGIMAVEDFFKNVRTALQCTDDK